MGRVAPARRDVRGPLAGPAGRGIRGPRDAVARAPSVIARDATNGEAFDDRQGTIVGASLALVRPLAIAASVPAWEARGLVAR
ncbi:MAG TPA: hypothetical protein VFC31_12590 [Candidatus Limnocylindria bacterium]|nr:hypothetical protein [Candidatus Limnocylindria bacterium]